MPPTARHQPESPGPRAPPHRTGALPAVVVGVLRVASGLGGAARTGRVAGFGDESGAVSDGGDGGLADQAGEAADASGSTPAGGGTRGGGVPAWCAFRVEGAFHSSDQRASTRRPTKARPGRDRAGIPGHPTADPETGSRDAPHEVPCTAAERSPAARQSPARCFSVSRGQQAPHTASPPREVRPPRGASRSVPVRPEAPPEVSAPTRVARRPGTGVSQPAAVAGTA